MFDVIVDTPLVLVREEAMSGHLGAMLCMGAYIQEGYGTAKDLNRALDILNYLHARRDDFGIREMYWNVLTRKMNIHHERGNLEQVDAAALEIVRDMALYSTKEWNHSMMLGATQWLHDRALDLTTH